MKFRRDKVDVVLLIVIAISAAILLLLVAWGYMELVHLLNYFVLVSGVVLVLNALVRHAMPEYRRSEEAIPSLLIGLLAICIGASNLYGRGVEWVEWLSTLIILVLAILIIVYSYRLRKRRTQK